jgi:hypothetical protein
MLTVGARGLAPGKGALAPGDARGDVAAEQRARGDDGGAAGIDRLDLEIEAGIDSPEALTKRSSSTTPLSASGWAATISPSRSVRRVVSKLSCAALRKAADSTKPPSIRPSSVQIAAVAIRRAASELSRSFIY